MKLIIFTANLLHRLEEQVIEAKKRVFTSWHEGRLNIFRHDEGAGLFYTLEGNNPRYSGFSTDWVGSENQIKEMAKRHLQEIGHHCSEKCTSWVTGLKLTLRR